MIPFEQAVEMISSGAVQILPKEELAKKLKSGKRLKVKFGVDPTAPDLHLGHAVVFQKLKQFQDLDHEVIFLIGDFTARIGDPTGRDKTRPPLDENAIKHNMKNYLEHAGKILDLKKVTVRYNSEWLSKLLNHDVVNLLSRVTLARITEREDFATRIKNNISIGFHELLYPIYQGYDSVVLHADVELGGTEQTFNILMGRTLQEQFGQTPQVAITMPLLLGLDGEQKMSKSLGNAIGLNDSSREAFGKLMSMSDALMWHYFSVLLGRSLAELSQMEERVAGGTLHPMELKKDMAYEIIVRFWSEEDAVEARRNFEALFQEKDYSQAQEVSLPKNSQNPIWIVDLLKLLGAINTSSEAKRLIESKAVSIDGSVVDEFKKEISWQAGTIIKVGKHRIYKIV